MMKRPTKVLCLVAILMQISSYFLPFVERMNGYEFFKQGIEVFLERGISRRDWYAFYAFFAPIFSFPILLFVLFNPLPNLVINRLKVGFLLCLLVPVLVSIGLIISIHYLGYILWVISFCLLYGILFFKKRVDEEIDMDDLDKHLIEDEI